MTINKQQDDNLIDIFEMDITFCEREGLLVICIKIQGHHLQWL